MSIQRYCPEAAVHDRDLTDRAMLFKSLGDPARVAILATRACTDHEGCAYGFTSGRGLKDAGLPTSVRRGTWGNYSLAPNARAPLAAARVSVLPTKVLA
jgi:hypothetical protein